MEYVIHTADSYRRMPWKNGLGVTREVRREPAGGDFHWRLSLAGVSENGPFSQFPNYTRIISILNGRGLALTIDGRENTPLLPGRPFIFSGNSVVEGELVDGPVEDINLIFDPQFCLAEMEWRPAPAELEIPGSAATALIYCPQPLEAAFAGEAAAISLAAGSTLEIISPAREGLRLTPAVSQNSFVPFCLMTIRPNLNRA